MYSMMQSTDYVGVRIKHTLADIKAFLKQDVDSLVECVADYQSSLANAMKKGERVQAKLAEIGSRNNDDWRKYFTTLSQLQEVLNGSHASWISAMKDLFIGPIKGMVPGNSTMLKEKSKMVKSALARFNIEQEKSRAVVQSLLSKPTVMSNVQPQPQFYDSMKTKDELFSTKRLDILRDLEYFQLEKAYEIAHMWSQLCSKQPHLANSPLIKRFALERYPPPPHSDWTSYSNSKRPALSEIMDGAEFRSEYENHRHSRATSFYKGLKHIFHWHPKAEESYMSQQDLQSSSDTTFGTNIRTDPSMQLSPHSASTLPSSFEIPNVQNTNAITTPSHISVEDLSPDFSPIPGPASDLTPPLEPLLTWASTPSIRTTNNSSPPTDSHVRTSTQLTISDTMQSFCSSNSQSTSSSPAFILEHLSPCSIGSSICDQSLDAGQSMRAQEIADTHATMAQNALDAINALRLQNEALAREQNARTSALRVHYAPDVVSTSYAVPSNDKAPRNDEDTSTQENNAETSCTTQTDSEDQRSEASEFEEDCLISETSPAQEQCADENAHAQEESSAEGSPCVQGRDEDESAELILQSPQSFSEYDGDPGSASDVYDVEVFDTSTADSVETIRGDSVTSENSPSSSMSDSAEPDVHTETGEEGDDEREDDRVALCQPTTRGLPKTEGWLARVSRTGRMTYVKKSDPGIAWTD